MSKHPNKKPIIDWDKIGADRELLIHWLGKDYIEMIERGEYPEHSTDGINSSLVMGADNA